MRDSNEFRDEVYRRAAERRRTERRRTRAVVGCAAGVLAVGLVLRLGPFAAVSSKDSNAGATADDAYGCLESAEADGTCLTQPFAVSETEETLPAVYGFSHYGEAAAFFTEKSGESESVLQEIGYTPAYFSEGNVLFVMVRGTSSSQFAAQVEETDEGITVRVDDRDFSPNASACVYLIPVPCSPIDGRSVAVEYSPAEPE